MSPTNQSTPLPQGLGIPMSDWQRTPTTAQSGFLSLLKRVDALESRLNRDSSNSSRPPSTDAAAKKRDRRVKPTERRKPGAKPGHPGHQQTLLEPTTTTSLFPDPCSCGHAEVTSLIAYRLSRINGENMEHVRYFLLSHIHDYVTYSAIGAHAMGLRRPNRVP